MILHKDLTPEYWFRCALLAQLSNVGADVCRAIKSKNLGKSKDSKCAIMRALELLSLTIADPKNRHQLKELIGTNVALIDYFYGDNEYAYTDDAWEHYFDYYTYAAITERRNSSPYALPATSSSFK